MAHAGEGIVFWPFGGVLGLCPFGPRPIGQGLGWMVPQGTSPLHPSWGRAAPPDPAEPLRCDLGTAPPKDGFLQVAQKRPGGAEHF